VPYSLIHLKISAITILFFRFRKIQFIYKTIFLIGPKWNILISFFLNLTFNTSSYFIIYFRSLNFLV